MGSAPTKNEIWQTWHRVFQAFSRGDSIEMCRRQYTCIHLDGYIHGILHNTTQIVRFSLIRTQRKADKHFGKPTSHYCIHPRSLHSVISSNKQLCIYKYQRLNNNKGTTAAGTLPQKALVPSHRLTAAALTGTQRQDALDQTFHYIRLFFFFTVSSPIHSFILPSISSSVSLFPSIKHVVKCFFSHIKVRRLLSAAGARGQGDVEKLEHFFRNLGPTCSDGPQVFL